MLFDEYIENNKEKSKRQSHLDMSTPCMPAVKERARNGNVGDYVGKERGKVIARVNLFEELGIDQTERTGFRYHIAHMCCNDTSRPDGYTCCNPKHLYLSTPSENCYDLPEKKRKSNSNKGATAASKKVYTCEKCGKQTKGVGHFMHQKACKG